MVTLPRRQVLSLALNAFNGQYRTSLRSRVARYYNHPETKTPFFGRTAEMARLCNLLEPSSPHVARSVAIKGIDGMGKTELLDQRFELLRFELTPHVFRCLDHSKGCDVEELADVIEQLISLFLSALGRSNKEDLLLHEIDRFLEWQSTPY